MTIGTYFGYFQESSSPGERPDSASVEALLASLGHSAFVSDLRAVRKDGTLHRYLSQSYRVRAGEGMAPFVSPLVAYDAVVYIDRISPVSYLK